MQHEHFNLCEEIKVYYDWRVTWIDWKTIAEPKNYHLAAQAESKANKSRQADDFYNFIKVIHPLGQVIEEWNY